MSNVALRIAGPAFATYRGASMYSKGDVTLTTENDTFDVAVDRFGILEPRSLNKNVQVSFVPDGRYAGYFGVLYPHAAAIPGSLTTPVQTLGTVTPATDVIALATHGKTIGDAVRIFPVAGATIPAGIVAGTRYYLGVPDANSLKLYATRANAIAGTSPIDITTAGSGEIRMIAQEILTILSADGRLYTFDVAAVATMPNLNALSTDTLFEAVTFDILRTAGVPATTAGSLFTLTTGNAFTEPGLDPSLILTQPYTFTWGAAPWSACETVGGFKWAFPMSTEEVSDDTSGRTGRRITNIGCTVRCQPIGPVEADVNAALLLQGAGAGRGARLGGVTDFVMSGTGVTVTAKGAGMRSGNQVFSRSNDRIGELEWFATRTFSGTPNPMFLVA